MRSAKLVDGNAVRQLVEAGRGRLSADVVEQVRALGIPVDGPVAATYPAAAWAQCVKLMAADLFPSLEAAEAQRRLAHLRMDVFAARFTGRVVFALSRLLGRERALARFVSGLRRTAQYLDVRFRVVGRRHYEVWISDVTSVPGFFCGMIEGGANHTGYVESVRIKALEGESCTLEIKAA